MRLKQVAEINYSSWIAGRSRDSAIGIATDYGLQDREVGVRVLVG
jgi:hypothetical protein